MDMPKGMSSAVRRVGSGGVIFIAPQPFPAAPVSTPLCCLPDFDTGFSKSDASIEKYWVEFFKFKNLVNNLS